MLFRIERRSFSEKESEQFTRYCYVVVQDFLPHLVNCFNALFPPRTVNELASCSPHVIHSGNTTLSSTQQKSTVQTTGTRGIQFKLEFDLGKLVEPLKIMLPNLFANDLYIADSLTQQVSLLHNDNVTNDNFTGTVGKVPTDDKIKSDAATRDDVMLNNSGETPVINGDHDQGSQESTSDNNKQYVKESMTDLNLPAIPTDLQQDTTVI